MISQDQVEWIDRPAKKWRKNADKKILIFGYTYFTTTELIWFNFSHIECLGDLEHLDNVASPLLSFFYRYV